ncbi:MAG: chromosomal replication initiator protein DnaA [Deferribacteraceae bacterium]|jgi:chromosomal replication initiator protein|nr:chromosomal replication initiator protein DnaA [Deferribacteraceae bacterium]
MHDQSLWEGVLTKMSQHVKEELINTWLRPAKISADGDAVNIFVPHKFAKTWVEREYLEHIRKILQDDYGIDSPVQVQISQVVVPVQPQQAATPKTGKVSNSSIDSIFTFDNFVNGDSNNFAYSAAQAVAEGNFSIYNPLYIYGGTGLGKTHLMYAIANKVREKFPKSNIMYMTSDAFTKEMVSTIRGHDQEKIESAKDRFKAVDLFMLDDIQFLEKREKTLELFFNIFNDLHLQRRQVVITSDKSPQEIDMEERMRSRFASGFQAEVNPPAVEEKVAILMQKSEELGFSIDSTLAFYLAENVDTKNVRDLIGALKRVHLYASVQHVEMSVELAEKAISDSGQRRKANIVVSPQQLITVVSDAYNVKLSDLVSKKRTHSIVLPRQVAMFLMKERLNLSLKEIGMHFGGRDHSTVKYAVDSIRNQLATDEYLKEHVEKISKKTFG